MKRAVYLCVIFLCSISFAFAQGAKPRRTSTNGKKAVRTTVASPFAEAERAWIPFWRDFTKAIKSRDRNSLKELISKDYDCYGGSNNECSCGNFVDKREIFFCQDKEWEHLDWIYNKTTTIEKINKNGEDISRTISSKPTPGYQYINFKYEKDKKWYVTYSGSSGYA